MNPKIRKEIAVTITAVNPAIVTGDAESDTVLFSASGL